MRRCAFVATLLMLILSMPARPQGEATLLFLLLDPSSRSMAMAGAYTGLANDIAGMHYNPAGLAQLKTGSAAFSWRRVPWSSRFKLHTFHGGAAWSLSDGETIAFDYKRINYGESVETDVNGNEINRFTSYEWALAVGYARQISAKWSLGGSLKLARSLLTDVQVDPENASGIGTTAAFDIGVLYQNFAPSLVISGGEKTGLGECYAESAAARTIDRYVHY